MMLLMLLVWELMMLRLYRLQRRRMHPAH